jgi:hypothetical protein
MSTQGRCEIAEGNLLWVENGGLIAAPLLVDGAPDLGMAGEVDLDEVEPGSDIHAAAVLLGVPGATCSKAPARLGTCKQCAHGRSAHHLYWELGDPEPWSWCDECGGRCEFVAAEEPPSPPLTASELIALAAWRMCDMGFGAYVGGSGSAS